jgi:hypothetical protein
MFRDYPREENKNGVCTGDVLSWSHDGVARQTALG